MVTKKVVHLTSVHPPFDIRVFHKECVSISEANYETVLVAPHGRDETVQGVRVCAVPVPATRRARVFRTTWHVFKSAVGNRADLYHFHDPELIPVALLLKLLRNRVVYDAHENLAEDILTKEYVSARWRKSIAVLAGGFERLSASFFDAIVAATPAIAKQFPAKKTITVQNCAVLEEQKCAGTYSERPFLAAYIGGATVVRGIKEIVQALELLPKNIAPKAVVAAHFSPPELEFEVKRMPGWERVEFAGWLPQDQVASLLGRARMGLVLFHPCPNHLDAQPHKLFDYMAAGIPIVASDFPLWREMIQGANCGIVVDPLNPKAVAEAMTWLFEHPSEAEAMGNRGRELALSRFNWTKEKAKLLDLYQRILGESHAPSMSRHAQNFEFSERN